MPDTLIELARRYRTAVEKQDTAVLNQLIQSYKTIYARLKDKIDLLALQLKDTENLTAAKLLRMERYQELMAETVRELDRYSQFVGVQMDTASRAAMERGILDSRNLARLAAGDLTAGFRTLTPKVIETLTGFLDRSGPLYKRLGELATTNAQSISDKLIANIGLGKNPKAIAGLIRNELGGGLTDALRMTRTVQIYSYREASRANYAANSDIVNGWYWMSALDDRSCMSCISQHGTLHPLDEVLDDHFNGLCTMVPAIIGAPSPFDVDGKGWFDAQSDQSQRERMGETKWQAWKDGKFDFAALSQQKENDIYGHMRSETPLKDLIGAE